MNNISNCVLIKILLYIPEKERRETKASLKLTCKHLYKAIRSIFPNRMVKLSSIDAINDFCSSLQRDSSWCFEINGLQVNEESSSQLSKAQPDLNLRTEYSHLYKNLPAIFKLCSNLNHLSVSARKDDCFITYFTIVRDNTCYLKNLQRLDAPGLGRCSKRTAKFYLDTILNIKDNITQLEINKNTLCKVIVTDFGRLDAFTKLFPHLHHLKIRANKVWKKESVHFVELIESNKELKTFSFISKKTFEICMVSDTDLKEKRITNSNSLERVVLSTVSLHINTLRYIIAKCKRLHHFELYVSKGIAPFQLQQTPTTMYQFIQHHLVPFIEDIAIVNLNIHFGGSNQRLQMQKGQETKFILKSLP
ncbi:uncharacterized protein BX663DRAFT_545664 [Cokeromyces recurvatus]|uniref:uncharacterized protein n=1 Tax=Cokeromyces recurvatus TaxID=90255 RepID=UPI00221F1C4F|nr:uncharacterized protein BX663DRAFT_545664 [Cokeromyces recurvatus]KAI7899539.1 hypothetical protein BX663DRAFT_545664 [Cokeromyces recurvatus]